MAYGRRVQFEPIREVAFGGIGAGYTAIGGATIDYTRMVSMFSTLDAEVYISLDGINDHIRIPVTLGRVWDFNANKIDDAFFIGKETTFYIKRVAGAPTSGNFWIEVTYAGGGL